MYTPQSNLLYKYLSGDSSRRESLDKKTSVTELNSVPQLMKGLQHEKQLLDGKVNTIFEELVQATQEIKDQMKNTQVIYREMDTINNEVLFDTRCQRPVFTFDQINFQLKRRQEEGLKTKNTFQSLQKDIEELQRNCAFLYSNEIQKLENLEISIFKQINQIQQETQKVRKQSQNRTLNLIQTLKGKKNQIGQYISANINQNYLQIVGKLQKNYEKIISNSNFR